MLAGDLSHGAVGSNENVVVPEAAVQTATGSIRGGVNVVEVMGGETASVGLGGVAIRLLNERGQFVSDTFTDGDGRYEFAGLTNGLYAVHELQPQGYVDGSAYVGSGGGIVFEPNLIGEITVTAGSELRGYDFAEISVVNQPLPEADVAPPLVPHVGSSEGRLNVLPQLSTLAATRRPEPFVAIVATPPTVIAAPTFVSASLVASTEPTVYGGSCRQLEGPTEDDNEVDVAERDRVFEAESAAVEAVTTDWQEEVRTEAEAGESNARREEVGDDRAA